MHISQRLQKFVDEWALNARLGKVSPLDSVELATLKLYDEWLTKQEEDEQHVNQCCGQPTRKLRDGKRQCVVSGAIFG